MINLIYLHFSNVKSVNANAACICGVIWGEYLSSQIILHAVLPRQQFEVVMGAFVAPRLDYCNGAYVGVRGFISNLISVWSFMTSL